MPLPPMIRDPWLKALVIVMLLIASLFLVNQLWQAVMQFSEVILLFFLAWMLAFVLEPVVSAIQRSTPLPRAVAVTATYLLLLLILASAVILLVPVLSAQITEASNQLPILVEAIGSELARVQSNLAQRGIYVDLARSFDYPELARRAETLGPMMLSNAVGFATGVATLLLQVTLIVILSFYIMLDGQRIASSLLATVPTHWRGDVQFFFSSVNTAFAGFLRGQLIQGLMNAIGTAIIMLATGLDLVLLISLAGGLLMMLPFFGPVLALLLPVAFAYLTKPAVFWLVLGLMFVLQQAIVNVIAPRLVGSMVGLHPLLVFLSVLVGMKLAGGWGVVFGIPIMAVLVAMLSFYHAAIAGRSRTEQAKQTAAESDADASQPETRTEEGITVP